MLFRTNRSSLLLSILAASCTMYSVHAADEDAHLSKHRYLQVGKNVSGDISTPVTKRQLADDKPEEATMKDTLAFGEEYNKHEALDDPEEFMRRVPGPVRDELDAAKAARAAAEKADKVSPEDTVESSPSTPSSEDSLRQCVKSLKVYNIDLRKHNEKIERMMQTIQRKNAEIEKLNAEVSAFSEKERMHREAEDVKQAQSAEEIAKLRSENKDLSAKAEAQKAELADCKRTCSTSSAHLEAANIKLTGVSALQDQMRASMEREEKKDEKIEAQAATIAELQAQLNAEKLKFSLKAQTDKLESSRISETREIAEKAAERKIESQAAEIRTLKSDISGLSEKSAALEEQLTAAKKSHEDELSKKSEQIDATLKVNRLLVSEKKAVEEREKEGLADLQKEREARIGAEAAAKSSSTNEQANSIMRKEFEDRASAADSRRVLVEEELRILEERNEEDEAQRRINDEQNRENFIHGVDLILAKCREHMIVEDDDGTVAL